MPTLINEAFLALREKEELDRELRMTTYGHQIEIVSSNFIPKKYINMEVEKPKVEAKEEVIDQNCGFGNNEVTMDLSYEVNRTTTVTVSGSFSFGGEFSVSGSFGPKEANVTVGAKVNFSTQLGRANTTTKADTVKVRVRKKAICPPNMQLVGRVLLARTPIKGRIEGVLRVRYRLKYTLSLDWAPDYSPPRVLTVREFPFTIDIETQDITYLATNFVVPFDCEAAKDFVDGTSQAKLDPSRWKRATPLKQEAAPADTSSFRIVPVPLGEDGEAEEPIRSIQFERSLDLTTTKLEATLEPRTLETLNPGDGAAGQ